MIEVFKAIFSLLFGQKSDKIKVSGIVMEEEKPMPKFKDESERLKLEFKDLAQANLPLYDLIIDLVDYVLKEFKKDVVITMINRTQTEQDAIYAGKKQGNREYDKNPWKSPHQYNHAIDLRSSIYSKEEIKQIEDYLNAKYNPINYYKWTAKDHDVGLGTHFHIQLVRK